MLYNFVDILEKLEEQVSKLVQANEDMRGRFDDARRQLEIREIKDAEVQEKYDNLQRRLEASQSRSASRPILADQNGAEYFTLNSSGSMEQQAGANAAELTRPRQRSERRNRSSSARPPEEQDAAREGGRGRSPATESQSSNSAKFQCGHYGPSDSKFCPQCGEQVTLRTGPVTRVQFPDRLGGASMVYSECGEGGDDDEF